ncbi:hypothetical protein LEP1GSC203_0378 [Leptospira terpstrae serovar Hualin str. LT 11-33 = ATCC 700639]|uniref:Uncharacterized protein n=1 Tax=Leptospira terpstrae serovar Hualin str. LT 11-33 = ATCC 700639 TaxID=1257025 RepID=N1VUC1_9LEPT|nr:hypothetical protein LEP1GSC203_0378 [Leptospira terpstrae serovar Hualin str. LT 11-33 = ATCC 700639]
MLLVIEFLIAITTYSICKYITSDITLAIISLFLELGINITFDYLNLRKTKIIFNTIALIVILTFSIVYSTDLSNLLDESTGTQYTGTVIENFKISSAPIAEIFLDQGTIQVFRNNEETILAFKQNSDSYLWARSFIFNDNSCFQSNLRFSKIEYLLFRKVIYIRSNKCMGKNGIYLWPGNYFHSIVLSYFEDENWH